MAAPISCATHFPQVKLLALPDEPGLRRRLQCRLPRGRERHRGPAEQRHARGARFPGAAARRLPRSRRLRRLLPDLLQRPGQAARRDRPDARLVAGWRPARAPPHRPGDRRSVSRASTAAADRAPSTARKFLELGGFDALLAPFYLEDTDLGYLAWKRGWKVLYQPRSVVYHEHRGTIGKRFREEQIQAVLKKNLPAVLLEEHPRVARAWCRISSSPGRARCSACCSATCRGGPTSRRLWRAFRQLPQAVRSRWRAPRAGARQRHGSLPAAAGRLLPRPLRADGARARAAARAVRFALSHLPAGARRRRLHVPDAARDWRSWRKCTWSSCWTGRGRRRTTRNCASSAPRPSGWCGPAGRPKGMGSLLPHAVREFANDDLEWLIHRQLYHAAHRRAATRIHAHGAVSRRVPAHRQRAVRARRLLPIDRPRPGPHDRRDRRDGRRASSICARCATSCARCRRCDQVQVCTPANRDYLLSFLPGLAPKLRAGLRAGIDTVALRIPHLRAASR